LSNFLTATIVNIRC